MRKRAAVAAVTALVGMLPTGVPAGGSATVETPDYTMDVLVGPNPLMKSTGMVIYRDEDEHFLYSADTLRNTIFRVDLDTFAVDRIAHDYEPAGQLLISPHTLELDEQGQLYVTEYAPQTVRRLNRDGTGRALIAAETGVDESGSLTGTSGIAFDPDRTRLFVGDNIHNRNLTGGVWEIDPLGVKPAEQIIRENWMVEDISIVPGPGTGELLAYVTDVYGGAIRVVDVDTREHLATRDLTGFDKPWGNKYDAERNRLLVTEMPGRLWEVDLNTGKRRLLARIDRPGMTSIAIDPGDGAVYVSNGLYGGLYRLDEPRRKLVPVLAEGAFAIPTSLNQVPADATFAPGTLWVGDMTSISTLAPDGKVHRVLNSQVDDYQRPNPDEPVWITASALQTDRRTVYFGETGFFDDRISRLDLRTGRREVITAPGAVSIPHHIRRGPDDDLLVTDIDPSLAVGRLVRVDPGEVPATTRVLIGDLQTPGGLRYDPDTRLAYVSEVAPVSVEPAGVVPAGRIWAVNVDTAERTLVAAGLHSPEGLDLDGRGGLVVVEGDGPRRLVRIDLRTGAQEVIAAGLPTKLRGPFPFPLAFDMLADVLVRDNGEIVVTAPEDASVLVFRPAGCTPSQRQAFLRAEQTRVLGLVADRGLTTLRDETDLARLAAPHPESGTAYNFYDHQFVSAGDIGVAVINTGELGPGKPDLLLYAPSPEAVDVTDPYGPDFPYTLVGWGYAALYTPMEPPTFLGPCIVGSDWFVHERSIHPADDWANVAVPPEEEFHGQVPGHEPPLPHECDPPCPVGFAHGRLWDIHLWLGDDGAAVVSLLSPEPIPGFDPEVGTSFFFPEGSNRTS